MDTLSYKTISANKETAKKEWVVIDATDQVVGRLCSKVAKLLRGKYKPNFTPHVDCGDNVIIINAKKVVFTGKKETDKVYTRYTGYPGGQRFTSPALLRKKKDGVDKMLTYFTFCIYLAVVGQVIRSRYHCIFISNGEFTAHLNISALLNGQGRAATLCGKGIQRAVLVNEQVAAVFHSHVSA